MAPRSTRSSPRRDPVEVIEKVFGVRLRSFQRDWLTELFSESDGKRTYTRALWGLPRGNGKSHIAAAVAGYMLLSDRPRDGRPPQVVIAAGSWQQGMITFKRLREFIESSDLAKIVDVLSGRGFMRIKGGAELFVVSAEGPLQHGLEPTCVIFDEVWNQTKPDLYEALLGGMVKRPEPLMVMISTAGFDQTSLLWELKREGEAGNPRFFYRWHDAPEDGEWKNPETWKEANPAMACEEPFMDAADLEDSLASMHENAFRRWHLNQWTAAEGTWMSAEAWDACAGEPEIPDGSEVMVGIDASIRHDSTAVVIVRRDGDVYHASFRTWTPPPEIQLSNVEDYLRDLSGRYRVKAFCYDKQFMAQAAQNLEDEGLMMVEWPQNNINMVPATRQLYEIISSARLRHGGDETARTHALNAAVRETERGLRIKKTASSGSDDCVIALAMAVNWASRVETERRSRYSDPNASLVVA